MREGGEGWGRIREDVVGEEGRERRQERGEVMGMFDIE